MHIHVTLTWMLLSLDLILAYEEHSVVYQDIAHRNIDTATNLMARSDTADSFAVTVACMTHPCHHKPIHVCLIIGASMLICVMLTGCIVTFLPQGPFSAAVWSQQHWNSPQRRMSRKSLPVAVGAPGLAKCTGTFGLYVNVPIHLDRPGAAAAIGKCVRTHSAAEPGTISKKRLVKRQSIICHSNNASHAQQQHKWLSSTWMRNAVVTRGAEQMAQITQRHHLSTNGADDVLCHLRHLLCSCRDYSVPQLRDLQKRKK